MKKVFFFLVATMLIASCNPTATETVPTTADSTAVAIDTVQVDTAKVDSL